MAEVKIITEDKEEKKDPDKEDIKEVLKKADEYQKLKEETDKLELEYLRNQDVKAKIAAGGKAEAGIQQKEKTHDDLDQEAADKMIGQFNVDNK